MTVNMSENKVDLFLFLSENKSINSSTIKSLKEFGFDSSDALLALDYDKDFPLLTTINLGQKSLLRRLLNDYKGIENENNNYDNYCAKKCCESHFILRQIHSLIAIDFGLNQNKSIDYKKFDHLLKQKEKAINKLENELRIKEKSNKMLEKEVLRLRKEIKLNGNKFKDFVLYNKNSLQKMKNYLTKNSEHYCEEEINYIENNESNEELIETSDETDTNSQLNESLNQAVNGFKNLVENQLNVEPIHQKESYVENTEREMSVTVLPINDFNDSNSKINCSDINSKNGLDSTSNNVIYELSMNSNKRFNEIENDCLDSQMDYKRLKGVEDEYSSTHIFMISVDGKDGDTHDLNDCNQNTNQLIISTITGSRVDIDLNDDSIPEDYDNNNNSCDLLLTQNIESSDNVSHISTSNGYLSDSNEENKCSVNTNNSHKGFKCQINGCHFATLFKPKFDDHVKNHVNYHLGQEIPEFWRPHFNKFMEKKYLITY